MKFSFDFPEPAVAFGGHRFSFLIFTEENTYSLDRAGMRAEGDADTMALTADGFTWAGGQQKAPGKLLAKFTKTGTTIEWDVSVEMDRAIKTVTTVVRDVPKGPIPWAAAHSTTRKTGTSLAATPSARATCTARARPPACPRP